MSECVSVPELGEFAHFDHDPSDPLVRRGHCVYHLPTAGGVDLEPVIVLHEAGGLSKECARLARDLAAGPAGGEGFAVYMPLLFGKPLPDSRKATVGNLLAMCVSREFAYLRNNRSSKVTHWVRSLAQEVAARHNGSRVGLIGMCLTAHVVFPLVYDAKVGAVVACHSSIPWTRGINTAARRTGLGMSREDYDRLAERKGSSRAEIGALRFRNDPISPCERMTAVRALFDDAWIHEVDDTDQERSLFRPHSVLTSEYDDAGGSATREAYDRVVGFLRSSLSSS